MNSERTEAIEETLRNFVREQYAFNGSPEELRDDESLSEAGIVDSAGVLPLILYVEETFGIRVADSEVVRDNVDSIAKISAFVRRKLAFSEDQA